MEDPKLTTNYLLTYTNFLTYLLGLLAFQGFFPKRDCVTLVRPMLDESALQTLTEQPYESLRADFRSGVEGLRERFFERMELKTMYGKNLAGKNLATLTQV